MTAIDSDGLPQVKIDWRLATAAAAALSLLFAAENVAVLGFRQTYLFKLGSQAMTWGLWLVLLPVVFAVARRAHAMPVRSWRRWTFEIAASLAITLVHCGSIAVAHWVLRPPNRFGFVVAVRGLMSLSYPSDVLRYWFIAAIYHALA